MKQRTITIASELAEEARQRTKQEDITAFVNEAVKYYLQALSIRELEAELAAEHGPVSDQIRDEVAALKWIG